MRMTPEDLIANGYELTANGWQPVKKKKPGRSKYGNKKVTIDGILFDSGREGKRYKTLKILQKVGEISDLKLQVKYPLANKEDIESAKKRKLGKLAVPTYVADFVYVKDGEVIVEDSKGHKTNMYRLKKRFMKLIHDIDILET